MRLDPESPEGGAAVIGSSAPPPRPIKDKTKASPSRWTPYWQAAPMAIVFFIFFVLPLAAALVVSFWRYNEYSIIPAFTLHNYFAVFDQCVSGLPNLCTTFATYLSTLKFCLIVWSVTLVLGFTIAYFLAFHIRTLTSAKTSCMVSVRI